MKNTALVVANPPRLRLSHLPKSVRGLGTKDVLTGAELSRAEIEILLNHAALLKAERKTSAVRKSWRGKTLALLLDKQSLRTKFSFSVAVHELGGQVIESNGSQRKTETPEDTARVLAGYCHAIVCRTFDQTYLERMAAASEIPVVNALSDDHHPCQILADLLALKESFGSFHKLEVAYIGDGNNILKSLLLLLPFMGIHLRYACPKGYEPDAQTLALAHQRAEFGGGSICGSHDPKIAVAGANALYTDVWTSMGFEQSAQEREMAFQGYQINRDLYALADTEAVIMHCMPVERGKEIADEMIEHPHSILFQQSENRLHVQKALLEMLVRP